MSEGKSGAAVSCEPGDGGSIAAIPIIIAGLVAVGIAKGIHKGYTHIKKTRAESTATVKELFLNEMMSRPGLHVNGMANSPALPTTTVTDVNVAGFKFDSLFSQLSTVYEKKSYDSGLYAYDCKGTAHNDRVVVLGLSGSDVKVAMTKDADGQYHAHGISTSQGNLTNDVNNIVSAFYRNEMFYQLNSPEWGFKDIKLQENGKKYTYIAMDKLNPQSKMTVEINKTNGQVSFTGIPVRMRDNVKNWLERYSECRITKSGDATGIKTTGPTRKRISG